MHGGKKMEAKNVFASIFLPVNPVSDFFPVTSVLLCFLCFFLFNPASATREFTVELT